MPWVWYNLLRLISMGHRSRVIGKSYSQKGWDTAMSRLLIPFVWILPSLPSKWRQYLTIAIHQKRTKIEYCSGELKNWPLARNSNSTFLLKSRDHSLDGYAWASGCQKLKCFTSGIQSALIWQRWWNLKFHYLQPVLSIH